jgi:hypothetical protein
VLVAAARIDSRAFAPLYERYCHDLLRYYFYCLGDWNDAAGAAQQIFADGKRRIILAALVTPADVMENVPLQDLLWRVCFRHKLRPHKVTGDTTYGTTENIVALEDAGIQAFFPLARFRPADAVLWNIPVHLRCPARCVPVPAGVAPTASHDQVHRSRSALPGRRRDLQHVSSQSGVHGERPRPDDPPLPLR